MSEINPTRSLPFEMPKKTVGTQAEEIAPTAPPETPGSRATVRFRQFGATYDVPVRVIPKTCLTAHAKSLLAGWHLRPMCEVNYQGEESIAYMGASAYTSLTSDGHRIIPTDSCAMLALTDAKPVDQCEGSNPCVSDNLDATTVGSNVKNAAEEITTLVKAGSIDPLQDLFNDVHIKINLTVMTSSETGKAQLTDIQIETEALLGWWDTRNQICEILEAYEWPAPSSGDWGAIGTIQFDVIL